MHSIVGASVSSNAMDAQARGQRLVRCGWCGTVGAAWLVRPKAREICVKKWISDDREVKAGV